MIRERAVIDPGRERDVGERLLVSHTNAPFGRQALSRIVRTS